MSKTLALQKECGIDASCLRLKEFMLLLLLYIYPPWHGREINTYSYSRTHAFESMGRDCLEEAQKEGGGEGS
jgi:hypothetical protein